MKTEYDFSSAKRGQFYNKNLSGQAPIYLERTVQEYFLAAAEAQGTDINQLINDLLKKQMVRKG